MLLHLGYFTTSYTNLWANQQQTTTDISSGETLSVSQHPNTCDFSLNKVHLSNFALNHKIFMTLNSISSLPSHSCTLHYRVILKNVYIMIIVYMRTSLVVLWLTEYRSWKCFPATYSGFSPTGLTAMTHGILGLKHVRHRRVVDNDDLVEFSTESP